MQSQKLKGFCQNYFGTIYHKHGIVLLNPLYCLLDLRFPYWLHKHKVMIHSGQFGVECLFFFQQKWSTYSRKDWSRHYFFILHWIMLKYEIIVCLLQHIRLETLSRASMRIPVNIRLNIKIWFNMPDLSWVLGGAGQVTIYHDFNNTLSSYLKQTWPRVWNGWIITISYVVHRIKSWFNVPPL